MKERIRRALHSTVDVRVEQPPGPHATYVGNDRLLLRLPDGRHLYAVASDLSITPELVTRGMYDWPLWNFLHRVLRPGDTAVDVGANIGLFTLAMAGLVGPSGRVVAYEPDEVMAQLVEDNVTSNWVGGQVEVVRAAAGAEAGEVTFSRHPRFLGSSTAGVFTERGRAITEGYEPVTVPVERLDQRVSGHVRYVKVDVEGGEAAVLAGADDLTADFWDVEVVLDMAPDRDELLAALRTLPGEPHVIEDDGSLRRMGIEEIERVGVWSHVVFATDPRAM